MFWCLQEQPRTLQYVRQGASCIVVTYHWIRPEHQQTACAWAQDVLLHSHEEKQTMRQWRRHAIQQARPASLITATLQHIYPFSINSSVPQAQTQLSNSPLLIVVVLSEWKRNGTGWSKPRSLAAHTASLHSWYGLSKDFTVEPVLKRLADSGASARHCHLKERSNYNEGVRFDVKTCTM